MKLKELVGSLETVEVQGGMDKEIRGVTYDSRKALPGYLFVCIDGFTTDGHKYAQQAVDNGACALVVEKDVNIIGEDITLIKVRNSRKALALISANWFGNPSRSMTLVGVTGTKGKTTTTYMIHSILEKAGRTAGLIGTVANCIGREKIPARRTTPESYDLQEMFEKMKEMGADTVVMEVSSQGLKLDRVTGCNFDIGLFTNFSKDHIGGFEHPDMEDYFKSKLILFRMCKKGIVNVDAAYSNRVLDEAACEVLTFGIEKPADVRAENITTHSDSVEFDAVTPWFRERVKVSVPGFFSVYNALGAIAACGLMGVPFEAIRDGLLKVQVPGRAEVVPTPGKDYTVMIDYAHTPDSLENILSTVKGFARGRLISVFGCGGDRDRTKRPLMGEVSGRIADFTIITSDNPRTEEPMQIIRDIEEGIKKTDGRYTVIEDRTEAIRYAMENAECGDIIVLAGKGHETYQIFKDKTIHYDEREIVENILKELE
ncbi:MAG TPA: UDP-N-acetylmuramoyl-L-alanyl-D-glutamate--2,6-diaminopimelate ligase [Thermoclostridium sp.]|mgnify:FL=1|nr:UDP-N-acetylmuramoyl-L-alanyl-D-glutamate--2,6-diaminopimelate ligase [Clostridiaceae bacterium]HOQ76319.1 UDP-N-acetylmuramoyl-L-alanyl-D-glutamate--2,6-diaminopimelate ligase [Thermoclostridium sp.]HPU45174.1 UDP-N-acetylmuramoyl-L-alanyl-D-glutamate--2,6-diaminopimelate ligase [Thermoclostridium sp.]